MSKPRKLHQIKGTIQGCWPGQVSAKSQWRGQPFYYLDIISESLFTGKSKAVLYAFPNLVSKDLWKTLELGTYKD